jgi:hypothetical protein
VRGIGNSINEIDYGWELLEVFGEKNIKSD